MKKIYTILTGAFLLASNYVFAQPTQPGDPKSGNSNNCTSSSSILTCPVNSSGVTTSFTNGVWNRGGNANSHLSAGAVWRFTNITNVNGTQVNAEVNVDVISNATLVNSGSGGNTSSNARIEDDNSVTASFFAPQIAPNVSGNGNARGYVQFTMSFFDNTAGGFTNAVNLQNLNFVHLDIDGNGNSSAWFRETGVALSYGVNNPTVFASSSPASELTAYSYTDNTTSPSGSWTGFAGSVFERDGVSTCAEIAVAYRYTGNRNSITFRMGYDYKGTGNPGTTARQYGSTFGCFNFPQEAPLPVKLLSFTGTYRSQTATLNWETTDEKDFSHYEIERSSNGSDFTAVGTVAAQGNNISSAKQQYQFADNLSSSSSNIFYYRLKMIDIDGKAKYSNIVLIRKDEKNINGISIAPNPVVNGTASIRFSSSAGGTVELRVIDLTGKIVLRQQNKIYEGNNSVSVNDLSRLLPGVYTIQVSDGQMLVAAKFSVIK